MFLGIKMANFCQQVLKPQVSYILLCVQPEDHKQNINPGDLNNWKQKSLRLGVEKEKIGFL